LDPLHPWDEIKARIEIWRIFRLLRAYGPVDHVKSVVADGRFIGEEPFELAHKLDVATFECTFFLNARQPEYFKRWPSGMRFARVLWFMQAMFASQIALKQFTAGRGHLLGIGGVSPDYSVGDMVDTTRRWYQIDKKIERVFQERFSTRDGGSMSLATLYDEASEYPLTRFVTENLDRLPARLDAAKKAFGTRAKDEMTTWHECATYIFHILGNLVSIAAAYDDTQDWTWRQARLFENDVFRIVFGPSWPELHADWRGNLMREGESPSDVTDDVRAALRDVFARLGIHLLERPVNGISVLRFVPVEVPKAGDSRASR
jgi:hypothetical protein